jgi:hypothetical protein
MPVNNSEALSWYWCCWTSSQQASNKIINSQEKCETNFIIWVHKVFSYTRRRSVWAAGVARTTSSQIPVHPMCGQHACTDCCDGITDPRLQIFNSCNLGSVNSILNCTERSLKVYLMSGDREDQSSGPCPLDSLTVHLQTSFCAVMLRIKFMPPSSVSIVSHYCLM